jgi:nucleoside-triphosphatase
MNPYGIQEVMTMSVNVKNVLLTGEPAIGKTTIILEVLKELNINAGGFFTHEIRSGKTRKGFQLITLDGDQAVLAHSSKKSSYKVGKYGVDLKVMCDLAVPAMKKALDQSDLIIIDEIGKMECFSIEFRDMAQRCLDSNKPVLGSMQNFANPFINHLNNRDDIVRISVTEANRDSLPSNLVELVKRLLPPKRARKKKYRNR